MPTTFDRDKYEEQYLAGEKLRKERSLLRTIETIAISVIIFLLSILCLIVFLR